MELFFDVCYFIFFAETEKNALKKLFFIFKGAIFGV